MPDIIVSLTPTQATRFQAAAEARLLARYREETGVQDPTPQQFGEWVFKYLGRRFVLRYEQEVYESGFNPDPFEGAK